MFLGALENLPGRLVAPSDMERGNFLTFASPRAAHHYKVLHERRVVTDYRGDRLRIGFGIYHSEHDVERLVRVIEDLGLE
jgi:selenocysteine lyase/cysteine desulfurase